MEPSRTYVVRAFRQLDERFKSGRCGLRTGVPSLDDAGGLVAGDLVVLGGRPGVGKTSLAIHIATQAALHETPSAYFTLAERGIQIIERALAAASEVARSDLLVGQLRRRDMGNLTASASLFSRMPLHIDDAIDLTACRARALIAEWRETNREAARALVIIDCVQLLCGETGGRVTRDEEVAAAMRTLQNAANESRVAIVLVAQLSGGASERPELCELRDSCALEALATAVVLAHRPVNPERPFELILAKHRRAAVPRIDEIGFDVRTGAFHALAPEADAETDVA